MTQQIKQAEGALGYVELIYALSNNSVRPYQEHLRQVRRAFPRLGNGCRRRGQIRQRHRFPGVDHRRPGSRGLSDLVLHLAPGSARQQGAAKAKPIRDFLAWMITPEAQKMAADLKYSPLPRPVVPLVRGTAADPEGRRQGIEIAGALRSTAGPRCRRLQTAETIQLWSWYLNLNRGLRPAESSAPDTAGACMRLATAAELGRTARRTAGGGSAHRGRRNLPQSDLHQVVRRVRQGDRRADQLPVDRLGRRHPAVHRGHRGLRRHRRRR